MNEQRPRVSTSVEMPHAGNYAYRLVADGIFVDQFGQQYQDKTSGEGTIRIREGAVFLFMQTLHGVELRANDLSQMQ